MAVTAVLVVKAAMVATAVTVAMAKVATVVRVATTRPRRPTATVMVTRTLPANMATPMTTASTATRTTTKLCLISLAKDGGRAPFLTVVPKPQQHNHITTMNKTSITVTKTPQRLGDFLATCLLLSRYPKISQ